MPAYTCMHEKTNKSVFCIRIAEANGSHNPYKDTLDRQRQERKREADRKLEEDRQKVKEVCSYYDSLLMEQGIFSYSAL